MTFFQNIRTAVRKRAAYNRTVAEIAALPNSIAWDLNIYQGDADKLAQQAVYGH